MTLRGAVIPPFDRVNLLCLHVIRVCFDKCEMILQLAVPTCPCTKEYNYMDQSHYGQLHNSNELETHRLVLCNSSTCQP